MASTIIEERIKEKGSETHIYKYSHMSINVPVDFPTTLARDLINFCTGKRLGAGIDREVFDWPFDKTLVLKVETSGFQNVREYEIWDEIKHQEKYAKNFAPCVWISPCGCYLLQKKTHAIPKEDYPEKVPSFFFDTKYDNYGILVEEGKRRFVVHDYGSFSLCNGYNARQRKADWWE